VATKLQTYNLALGHLEDRKLASLSEAREPRRVLDDFWDTTCAYALERGFWNFAMRAVQADSSASITPTFGYTYAFTKPDDWVRTYVISDSEALEPPLLRYVDEPNLWYADCDPLFVKYVSNDTAYGMDLSIWPETFTDYVSLRLAVKACKRITGNDSMLQGSHGLLHREKRALAAAKSSDAMNEPPGFPPTGSWVRSRGNARADRRWDGSIT
jgi:hypothetical protein